jgi:type III secretory pathway component EscR
MEVAIDYTIYIGFLLFPPPIKLTATIKRILLKMGLKLCSNTVHGDVYRVQNHVIKIGNALLQDGGFSG